MKKIVFYASIFILSLVTISSCAGETAKKEKTMTTIEGSFEVNLAPQEDSEAPAGRMVIDKSYQGGLVGSGRGQMISKRTDNGSAIYFAIEEFTGTVEGKNGVFTLVHKGEMSKETQSLEVLVMEGSGKGALENISGSMIISQENGGHTYKFSYTF